MKQPDTKIYDAIVVGLGPGGSTVSLELAKSGLSVLALDQARFPRYKPCGGGLTLKIDRILDHDFHDLVERTVYGATVKFSDGRTLHVRSEHPVAYMVMRDRFDAFLVQKARGSSVQVKEGERVLKVREETDGVEVQTQQGTYKGRFLVGADGVNSLVRRDLGFDRRRRKAVLVEGEVGVREIIAHGLDDEALLEFGHVQYGYGWIFPKADHLSIGVGGIGPVAKQTKAIYREFVDRYDIFQETAGDKQHGYSLPFWTRKRRLTTQRTLLIGDAAGLVDPFIGEGIYYAARSGQLGAKAIVEAQGTILPDLSGYNRLIAREIYPEFEAARKIFLFVQTFPKLFELEAERNEVLLKRYFEVLRGECSYRIWWREAKSRLVADLMGFGRRKGTVQKKAAEPNTKEAARFDDSAGIWTTFLGKGAWSHFEELVTATVRPGAVVMDAGAGTGITTKMVLQRSEPSRLVGIEPSGVLLNLARQKLSDARVELLPCSLSALPFPDNTFDVVVSAWALERVQNPKAAVTEFLRVIKEDGYVIYLFSSLPERGIGRLLASMIGRAISRNGDQPFVVKEEEPYHNCPRSSLARFAKGLITVVVLRKCCRVQDEVIPLTGRG